MALLGKLKKLGDKIENVATNVAKEVVSGVQTGVTTVGTGVISVAKDIKDSVLDSDLERIRNVHAFQKQQSAVHRRKQLSERELDAADAKAAQVLDQLPAGYFEKDYDPVRAELAALGEGTGHEEVDAITERLGACVEAVSGKLSRHVMKRRDQLLVGIDVVATVEDDLKAALATARSGRGTLGNAAAEVQRHLRVARQTRRKQVYMQLMEVLGKIQQARDLPKLLRRAQESGEHQAAILMCVQCFHNVEPLKELQIAPDLLATVQRAYVDTLHKLDGAMTAICSGFDAMRYSKILDAYLLQRLDGPGLADKVLQGFRDAVQDATGRCIKTALLTQPQLVARLAAGTASLEGSFATLCAALPGPLVIPALQQVCEATLRIFGSYAAMAQWHHDFLEVHKNQARENNNGQQTPEAMERTLDFLGAVAEMLETSREEAVSAAVSRVILLLKVPAASSGPGLVAAAELCDRLLLAAEAFAGRELPAQRDRLGAALGTAFEAWHHSNMATLSALLQGEDAWKNVGGPRLAYEVTPGSVLRLATLAGPQGAGLEGQLSDVRDFAGWLALSSPFQLPGGAPVPPTALQPPNNSSAAGGPPAPAPPAGGGEGADGAAQKPQGAPQPPRTAVPSTSGRDTAPTTQPTGPPAAPPAGPPAATQPMLTPAARHMLGCFKAYARLLRALGRGRAGTVWQGIQQLFERFLTATFVLISGISLEALVLQEETVTLRLRRVLLRILTADGSRYKQQVEELQRMKAGGTGGTRDAYGSGSTGISWLDRFGNKMESLANDLDRSVNKLSAAMNERGPEGAALLQDRLVAGEALAVVAGELRAARAAIIASLAAAAASLAANAPAPALKAPLSGSGTLVAVATPLVTGSPGAPPAPTPPPVVPAVRLQYAGMQQVLAAGAAAQTSAPSGGEAPQGSEAPRFYPMAQTQPGTPRDADAYFCRVVEAAWDLREALLQGAARSLLGRLLDPERGISAVVAAVTTYGGHDPPTRHHQWAEVVGNALRTLGATLAAMQREAQQQVQDQIWVAAMSLVADALTTGFSRVKRCTLEGRASMSMDLSYIDRVVRTVLPPGATGAGLATLKRTDAYVRALYLPWDELCRWCQQHVAEYGVRRLLPLIEAAADIHKVKRQHKVELLDILDTLSADF